VNRTARRETKCSQAVHTLLPFIPNAIGHPALSFTGKIRVPFAAGGAPAAVKRRAVNRSTKLKKNSLYTDYLLQNAGLNSQNFCDTFFKL
jgi:hypothetical protein